MQSRVIVVPCAFFLACILYFVSPVAGQTSPPADSAAKSSPWRSKNDSVFREASRKLWDVQLTFGVGGFVPVGSYLEGINAGVSGHAALAIGLTKELALRIPVVVGSTTLDYRGVSGDVTALRGSIGAMFHDRFSSDSRLPSEWYAYWGLGASSLEIDGYTETKFLSDFSLGALFALSPSVAIDAAIDLPIIYISGGNDEYATAFFLTGRVGVAFSFGGKTSN